MEVSARPAIRIRDRLEQEIVDGVLAPGARLDEARLAERFDVSRTPVREALQGLESAGLLELRPRRGAFVRKISAKELLEMFETMAELEAAAARFAAERIDQTGQQLLAAALERCDAAMRETEATGDPNLYYYENAVFHRRIYAASGNAFLERQTLALHTRLKAYRRLQLRARGRVARSQAEHRAIFDAIVAAKPAAAAAAARAHILVQGERFQLLLASLEEWSPPGV